MQISEAEIQRIIRKGPVLPTAFCIITATSEEQAQTTGYIARVTAGDQENSVSGESRDDATGKAVYFATQVLRIDKSRIEIVA